MASSRGSCETYDFNPEITKCKNPAEGGRLHVDLVLTRTHAFVLLRGLRVLLRHQLFPQFPLVLGELRVDVADGFALPDQILAVTAQEIINRFDTNPDGPSRLVLIQVLERKIRRTRILDDVFDHRIDRRIMAALEIGNF